MNPVSKPKLLASLAAIFVAGAVSGGLLTWAQMSRQMFRPPSAHSMLTHLRDRFVHELQLTPTQAGLLESVLEKQAEIMEGIHRKTWQEIDEVIRATQVEMVSALNLTADQQARLAAMEKHRQEQRQQHLKPRHTGGS